MSDALKGEVPFFEQTYDATDPVGTIKGFVSMSIGAFLLVAAVAVGRTAFNRASEETGQINKMEAF